MPRRDVVLSRYSLEFDITVRTDDFFLLAGYDQVLIAFKIENDSEGNVSFVHTDSIE
jgi:hypothetical protein